MNHKLLPFRYHLFNYHDGEIRSELLVNWILSTYHFPKFQFKNKATTAASIFCAEKG